MKKLVSMLEEKTEHEIDVWYEKEYVEVIEQVKDDLNISFKESNEQIYNTILLNVICTFEKNNEDVTKYISNFDVSVKITMGLNILPEINI